MIKINISRLHFLLCKSLYKNNIILILFVNYIYFYFNSAIYFCIFFINFLRFFAFKPAPMRYYAQIIFYHFTVLLFILQICTLSDANSTR